MALIYVHNIIMAQIQTLRVRQIKLLDPDRHQELNVLVVVFLSLWLL